MRSVLAIGLVVGVTTPLLVAGLVAMGFPRCIDSPQFLNPQPLGWAGAGAGLIAAGAALVFSARPRMGAAALALGIAFLALALAGPPYHSCAQYQGPFR